MCNVDLVCPVSQYFWPHFFHTSKNRLDNLIIGQTINAAQISITHAKSATPYMYATYIDPTYATYIDPTYATLTPYMLH